MQIFIKTPAGNTMVVGVTPNTYIDEVKDLVEDKYGMPMDS